MITITMPKLFAIAMIVWLVLDIIKMLLGAALNIADKKERKLEKEIEKSVRGIK